MQRVKKIEKVWHSRVPVVYHKQIKILTDHNYLRFVNRFKFLGKVGKGMAQGNLFLGARSG